MFAILGLLIGQHLAMKPYRKRNSSPPMSALLWDRHVGSKMEAELEWLK